MSARQTLIWTAAFSLHLLLIVVTSLQDISSWLAGGASILPASFEPFWRRTGVISSTILGDQLAPQRQVIATYADCTGIEAGYSYFAPTVPGNCKLAFELHYPDGRVEYDLPPVGGAAAGYRISTLLDHIQSIHYRPLREAILKPLVESIRREHPDAIAIRAVFGRANLPSLAQYEAGKRVSYQVLYVYDFRVRSKSSLPAER